MKELQEKLSKIKGFSISTSIRWQVNPKEGGGRSGFFSALRKAIKRDVTGSDQDEVEPEANASASGTLFDTYTETRKITLSSIPAAEFQIPAGYSPAK